MKYLVAPFCSERFQWDQLFCKILKQNLMSDKRKIVRKNKKKAVFAIIFKGGPSFLKKFHTHSMPLSYLCSIEIYDIHLPER